MDLMFPLLAFASSLLAGRRSLGAGFVAMLGIGYINGVVRANFLGIYTTFMFDAAVVGLYLGFILDRRRFPGGRLALLNAFVIALIAWPALLTLAPINNYLVQLVALRATVWFLPMLVIATRLDADDLAEMTRGLAVLNLFALAVGVYLFTFGVPSIYPVNSVTRIIYASNDMGGSKYHRIPSTFLNAHTYGGTMLLTLPFMFERMAGPGVRWSDRGLAALGMSAAGGGLLMCGARLPLIQFCLVLSIAWILNRCSVKMSLLVAGLIGIGALVAGTSDRLQRAATLNDSAFVTSRINGSVNESFVELFMEYPVGAGMGSAFGNSIPFFLADVAPTQIGLENEYSRILVDQGWVGLGCWVAFVAWLHMRPPGIVASRTWSVGIGLMYASTCTLWATSFIGGGTLSSVPASALLLMQMGVLAGVRERGALPDSGVMRPAADRPAAGMRSEPGRAGARMRAFPR